METIYSLVTKPINQNVAIIRISGPNTFKYVEKLFSNDINLKPNSAIYKELYIDGKYIDQAIVVVFKGPRSFTGEDIVEIQTHGNIFIVKKILSELNKIGIRQSNPGEFLKQAFENGKLDLSQVESINSLVTTENKLHSEKSSLNVKGTQSEIIKKQINSLSEIISRIQISIDYPENKDLPKYNMNTIKEMLEIFKNELTIIISSSKQMIKISKGIKIAIVGKPNVGKSSLLNSLIKENKAIVSDVKGTTRDVVEAQIYFNDVKVTLQDTAGIRNTDDAIEIIGIEKTNQTIENSDLIIFINEPNDEIDLSLLENHNKKLLIVINKSDLIDNALNNNTNKYIKISAKNNELDNLIFEIEKFIENNLLANVESENAILVTQNQIDKFESIIRNISNAMLLIDNNNDIFIISIEIQEALKKLGLILGIEINEDYLLNLFSNFCIGK